MEEKKIMSIKKNDVEVKEKIRKTREKLIQTDPPPVEEKKPLKKNDKNKEKGFKRLRI